MAFFERIKTNIGHLSKLNTNKIEIVKDFDKTYRTEEEKINQYIEEQTKNAETEINSTKESLLKQTDELSDQLIQKIIS